jgi:tetratricopeptide (TPR) repeat protein
MLSSEDKIAKGLELKEEGNAFVKAKDYKNALKPYKTVFLYINGLIGTCSLPLKLSTHSNLSLCYLKLNKLEQSLEQCQKALAVDKNHVKSLIRMGSLQMQRQQFEQAKQSLKTALELDPKNKDCLMEMARLKKEFDSWNEIQKEKQKQQFAGIFDKV